MITNFKYIFFAIVNILLFISIACKSKNISKPDKLDDYKTITYSDIKNDKEMLMKAIIRRYPGDGTTSGDFFVLHPMDDPMLGGIKWCNAPKNIIEEQFKKASEENGDVIAKMCFRFTGYVPQMSASSEEFEPPQINPMKDPLSEGYSIGNVQFLIVPKITLREADPSKYAK